MGPKNAGPPDAQEDSGRTARALPVTQACGCLVNPGKSRRWERHFKNKKKSKIFSILAFIKLWDLVLALLSLESQNKL